MSGSDILLKNGSPTLILTPCIASAKRGYSVPTSTVNVMAVNTRLFARKAVSRDRAESSRPTVRNCSELPATITSVAISTTAMKARK